MEENVIRSNRGIMTNVNVSVKNVKIILGILLHVIVKNGKYLASIMDDSAIICDEVMDANAKLSPKDNADAKR